MSSVFCSIDEAFSGPVMPQPKKKKSRSNRDTEGFQNVPPQLASNPMQNSEILQSSPPASNINKLESANPLSEFFPLPGNTADTDEWSKAFTLQPTQLPRPASNPFVADGKSTLWREAARQEPVAISTPLETVAPLPAEINRRLDALTRQIESLTTPTPLQSTAELFLFVAIGLLLLLAIDTLLRFATKVFSQGSQTQLMKGGRRFVRRWRGII